MLCDAALWNALIGTIAGKRQVEGVSCANVLGRPSLQALVLARYIADGMLDVYGFDHINANPVRIFVLPGLRTGDARISGYTTILTAEADQNLVAPDLFREFQWSASKGGLMQVAFPGIFPDLTRYQAEADQVQVDARQVALRFVQSLLDWRVPATALVTHAGGPFDVDATVRVRAELPGMSTAQKPYLIPMCMLTCTMRRELVRTANTPFVSVMAQWYHAHVTSSGGRYPSSLGGDRSQPELLTTIRPRSLIASPVKLAGGGSPFEGDIGDVSLLDHRYIKVGHAHLSVPPGWLTTN